LTAPFIELPPATDREDAFDLLNGAGELLVNYELNQENGLLAQMQKAIQKRLVEQYGYKSVEVTSRPNCSSRTCVTFWRTPRWPPTRTAFPVGFTLFPTSPNPSMQ
jgi:hypothetical protein